jgi:hypothetical protein
MKQVSVVGGWPPNEGQSRENDRNRVALGRALGHSLLGVHCKEAEAQREHGAFP